MDSIVNSIFEQVSSAALAAATPENFIQCIMKVENNELFIKDYQFDISAYNKIILVSFGKASLAMAESTWIILKEKLSGGIVITKHFNGKTLLPNSFEICIGGHPLPNDDSLNAARKTLNILDGLTRNDLVIFLISGGGSALLTLPHEGISMKEWQIFTSLVLNSGIDIVEFNTLRKHLDQVKGGGLVIHALPAECVSIILSDVVGSPLDSIASGPTVPDATTFNDAWQILEKYNLIEKVPISILSTLQQGIAEIIPETLKEKDHNCSKIHNILAADNRIAAFAAADKARELGIESVVLTTALIGEASRVGALLPAFFSEIDQPKALFHRPVLLIFGGETTVTIHGNGKGGRNQELALSSVRQMAKLNNCALITFATDGEDGSTDAAGAIVTQDTLKDGFALGMNPEDFLENNDSYHYFEKINALLKPGPSNTNVNDLTFLLAF